MTQLGCDTHTSDPLAHLELTTSAYRETASVLHELAHDAAGGRWVATGGGGYQWARVVPRAWTIYFAEMAGATLPTRSPRGGSSAPSSSFAPRCRPRSPSRRHARRRRTRRRGRRPSRMLGRRGPTSRRPTRALREHGEPLAAARTKLICTLGPATNTPAFVRGLVTAGASIFRVNFSHGTPDDHARAVVASCATPSGGRTGRSPSRRPARGRRCGSAAGSRPFRFAPGQAFELRAGGPGDEHGASTTYPTSPTTSARGTASCSPTARSSSRSPGIDGVTVRTECVRGGTGPIGPGGERARGAARPARGDRPRPRGAARALDSGSTWSPSRSCARPTTCASCGR